MVSKELCPVLWELWKAQPMGIKRVWMQLELGSRQGGDPNGISQGDKAFGKGRMGSHQGRESSVSAGMGEKKSLMSLTKP